MSKLPEIGTWGFIIGSNTINDEMWKRNFPQGFFGKVIGYEKQFYGTRIIIRCYCQNDRFDRKRKHGHLHAYKTYFKPL